jgi:hypothetical protein
MSLPHLAAGSRIGVPSLALTGVCKSAVAVRPAKHVEYLSKRYHYLVRRLHTSA